MRWWLSLIFVALSLPVLGARGMTVALSTNGATPSGAVVVGHGRADDEFGIQLRRFWEHELQWRNRGVPGDQL